MIDFETWANLMMGFYTCYWCGDVKDIHDIGEHVDNCLKEINWLRHNIEEIG